MSRLGHIARSGYSPIGFGPDLLTSEILRELLGPGSLLTQRPIEKSISLVKGAELLDYSY